MRRFIAGVATTCAFALVGSGLVAFPAVADEKKPEAAAGVVTSRPDAVSAQVSARASGQRVEDLSQRSSRAQVFANPDGTWTSESSGVVRFAEQNGQMVPVENLGSLESVGETITGDGSTLSIADGADKLGSGPGKHSVALATLEGTGRAKGKSLELGWEGKLPEPEVKDNVATYSEGVEAPVAGAQVKEESVEASVTVEPTRNGFSHKTLIDTVPEGDVELRFPLKLSKGLTAKHDTKTGELRAVDSKGDTAFFAAAPLMWDAKIDPASGLPAAQTPVATSLETEGPRRFWC